MSKNNQYKKEGFVFIKNLFSKEEMLDLLRDIHLVFRNQFEHRDFSFQKNGLLKSEDLFRFFLNYKNDYINCMNLVQNLVLLHKYGSHDKLIQKLKEVGLKNPVFSTDPLIFLNSKKTSTFFGNWKIPVHQDWRSIQGSLNSVVVWIPIVDCPIELGALQVIPGSHTDGLLPSEDDEWYAHVKDSSYDENSFSSVPMEAGDALIFSTFLLHRSSTNTSNEIRYSFQIRFNDFSESTFIERQYPNPYPSNPPQKKLITPDFPKKSQVESIFI